MRVNGNGRLVEKDELGLVRNSTGDVQAPQQAARKFFRAELRKLLQPYELYGLVNKGLSLFPVINVEAAEIVYVLTYRQLVEHSDVLRDDTYPALQVVAGGGHDLAEQLDAAL